MAPSRSAEVNAGKIKISTRATRCTTHEPSEFEDVPGTKMLRCILCSEVYKVEKVVGRRSVSGHRTSGRHVLARQTKQSDEAAARLTALSAPVEDLGIAQLLSPSIAPNDASARAIATVPDQLDLFSEVIMTDSGAYDVHGESILFSAGEGPRDTFRERISHQLDTLSYYEHTLFGIATSKGVSSSGDETEERSGDATISDTAARLQAMGNSSR